MAGDYYEVLGVERDASEAEIRRAYRKLVFKVHPDHNPNTTDRANELFQILQRAYNTLCDPDLRAEHDRITASPSADPDSARPEPEPKRARFGEIAIDGLWVGLALAFLILIVSLLGGWIMSLIGAKPDNPLF